MVIDVVILLQVSLSGIYYRHFRHSLLLVLVQFLHKIILLTVKLCHLELDSTDFEDVFWVKVFLC